MSDHLSAAQRDELEAALREQRARLLERGRLAVEDANVEPLDLQEQAAGEVAKRDQLLVSGMDRARLAEVEAALGRVADGTYGECEETGEPIPFARLRAEPTTRYTVEALEILESEQARAKNVARDRGDAGY
ncbi:MAG: TraR/DksA family transcriptional regulator [Myxococcota bacterium]